MKRMTALLLSLAMLLVLCASAAVILTLLLGGTLTAGQSVVR